MEGTPPVDVRRQEWRAGTATLNSLFDMFDQVIENPSMQGQEDVPVYFSPNTTGIKMDVYRQPSSSAFFLDIEF